jgi:DivIVA domain-containing protein
MPLKPEDVKNKKFDIVRMRAGYDTLEVDHFLAEVVTELTRLLHDNEVLRTRSSANGAGAGATLPDEVTASEQTAQEPAVVTAPAIAPAEASSRAARLLEIAANNADQLVSEAREEAVNLVTEAKSVAERLEADARTRSEKLDAETSDRRHQLFDELDQQRESLSHNLDELRSLELDCRDRLKAFFQSQLQILDGNPDGHVTSAMLNDPDTPRRLRELLAEDA